MTETRCTALLMPRGAGRWHRAQLTDTAVPGASNPKLSPHRVQTLQHCPHHQSHHHCKDPCIIHSLTICTHAHLAQGLGGADRETNIASRG